MEIFFKMLLQILSVSLLLVTSLIDYIWKDKRSKKFKTGKKWLFALTFIFLVSSTISTYVDHNMNKKEKQLYINQFTSLKDSLSGIKHISILLTNQISPFIEIAKRNYPTLPNEEALNRLQVDLKNIEIKTKYLEKKENIRIEEERVLAEIKNTPPELDVNLFIDRRTKELILAIQFKNKIPITFRYSITKTDNTIVGPIMVKEMELRPEEGMQFYFKSHGKVNSFRIPQNDQTKIFLEFSYSSIYQNEINNQKLSGTISKKYLITPIRLACLPDL